MKSDEEYFVEADVQSLEKLPELQQFIVFT